MWAELNQLQVTINEKFMDITDKLIMYGINKWIDGGNKENNWILTDDDIIEGLMAKKEYGNEDNRNWSG